MTRSSRFGTSTTTEGRTVRDVVPMPGNVGTRTARHRRSLRTSVGAIDVDSLARTQLVVGNRYRIEARIGRGGMGMVWKVRHLTLGKAFALKLIASELSANDALRKRFYEEAKLASSLSHPNIVSVVDFGEDPQVGLYMVMELVDGEPLSAYLAAQTRLAAKRWCQVLAQIAEAVFYIHERNVLHGDIKPDNILICSRRNTRRRQSSIQLLDFGLARGSGQRQGSAHIEGTPPYMPPERFRGAPLTASADIYSLGVLGYQLFTGHLPFDGSLTDVMNGHLACEPPPLATFVDEPFEASLEQLIMRALEKDVAARHPSVAAFLYELNAVADMVGGVVERTRAPRETVAPRLAGGDRAAQLALLVEETRLPIAGVRGDGTVVVANQAFAKLLTGSTTKRVDGDNLLGSKLARGYAELAADLRGVRLEGRARKRVVQYVNRDREHVKVTFWMVPAAGETWDVNVSVLPR